MNDKYEQEADRVANQVMRMLNPAVQCQAKPAEKEEVHAKGNGDPSTMSSSVESGINSIRGDGQPLPVSTRAFFEPRFGTDFSGVRVHSDAGADTLNRQLNTHAFTSGQDIFFRHGTYNPGDSIGRKLIAHELAHVVQQGASTKQLPMMGLGGYRQAKTLGRNITRQSDPIVQCGRSRSAAARRYPKVRYVEKGGDIYLVFSFKNFFNGLKKKLMRSVIDHIIEIEANVYLSYYWASPNY